MGMRVQFSLALAGLGVLGGFVLLAHAGPGHQTAAAINRNSISVALSIWDGQVVQRVIHTVGDAQVTISVASPHPVHPSPLPSSPPAGTSSASQTNVSISNTHVGVSDSSTQVSSTGSVEINGRTVSSHNVHYSSHNSSNVSISITN